MKFIAYLQIIGIVLVVVGHSFHEYPDGEMGHTMLLYRMLYSFRMPLFMFVSGFLMVFTTVLRSATPSWGRFAVGKLRRLLLPFLVLSLVTFVPRAAMSGMADDHLGLSAGEMLRSLVDGSCLVIPYFWFLQASFTLLIVSYALLRVARLTGVGDRITYPLLILLFGVLPWVGLDDVRYFSVFMTVKLGVFFALGAAYARSASMVDRVVPWTSPWFLAVAAAVWGSLFFLTETTAWSPLCSLAGIAMAISLAKMLEHRQIGVLDHLIGANYIIFLLSWYCNVLTQQVLHHYVELPWWIYTLLSIFSGIYIPWLFYRYMLRHPQGFAARFGVKFLGQSIKSRV
ncbi:MAG: acyltransferase [Staphylococcus sp.]|nr:acyltransferase [Staphylococcus sp.]